MSAKLRFCPAQIQRKSGEITLELTDGQYDKLRRYGLSQLPARSLASMRVKLPITSFQCFQIDTPRCPAQ